MRRPGWIAAAAAVMLCVLADRGHRNALADPVERQVTLALPDWPVGEPPVTVALLSDVHIGNSTMNVDRLARIVAQVDALRPDLILIAGDYVAEHEVDVARAGARDMVLPLSRLHAPLGVVAVLGNHDWSVPGLIRTGLEKAGITVLENRAVVRGPLVVGGVGDVFSGHDNMRATLRAMAALPGAKVIVTHSPDASLMVPPGIGALFAGHTHCGQVVLPIVGTLRRFWEPGLRCGLVRRGDLTTIISAGLGTSQVPVRIGAPPDIWIVTLKGR